MTSREMVAGDRRKFDFSWFVPSIVRYRKILGEVLLASFFLQILALMTLMIWAGNATIPLPQGGQIETGNIPYFILAGAAYEMWRFYRSRIICAKLRALT